MSSGEDAAGHLRHLARQPRPTGSDGAADARQYCNQVLSSLGYRVIERPFEYSAAVGRYGTPVAGGASLLLVAAGAALSLGGRHGAALIVLAAGFAGVALGGRWMARRGVLALPLLRRRGVNIEAVRGGDPKLWVVAHSDSKSQPVPLLVRAAGIVLLALATLAAFALAIAGVIGSHAVDQAWPMVIAAAILGAIPVLGSVVGSASDGAVDNASGVATILCVAEGIRPEHSVGVLITDAEELGLAGARAWCAETRHPATPVLNCDGIDDAGQLAIMWTRPRAGRLEDAVRNAAAKSRQTLRFTRLIPGVLVDAVAFSDAGWEAVTLSRGSVATLTRIHTRADDLKHLAGRGVVDAALLLGTTVNELMES